MEPVDGARAELVAAAWGALEAELDWARLGACYCEGDARGFFDAARRGALVEAGLALADDVAAALPARGPGRSLYLGAAVAEVVPILVEALVLGREVAWINLPGAELDELARALEVVGARLGVDLPRPTAGPIEHVAARSCDHLWMVSVLTDPDAFPALHDALYERAGTPQATGRGDRERERALAERLVDALLERAADACALTTTDEELVLVKPCARARGLALRVPGRARLSALVGDAVRVCRLERSGAEG